MKTLTENEIAVIRNVFKKLEMSELIDCGDITDEITGLSFMDFFADLPSVAVELSKQGKKYESFIKSLDVASHVLHHIAAHQKPLMDMGFFLTQIEDA